MKRIIMLIGAAILIFAVCLPLASCQLSQIFGEDTTKPEIPDAFTTASETTAATPETTAANPYEYIDFANTDISPYITLGEYKNIAITIKKAVITDEEFAAEIKTILEEKSTKNKITDRKTATGDTLNIDFEGFIDGVAFQGGTAASQEIILSAESGYIDGFADGLVGKDTGSTVELNLTFPTNYHEPTYAGKAVLFKVKINYIIGTETILPEYNDEFITTLTSGEYTTVAAFETYYRELLRANEQAEIEEEGKNTLWNKVMDNAVIKELPEQQYMYYYTSDKLAYQNVADQYGMSYEDVLAYYKTTDEQLLTDAKDAVKNDLVYQAVLKAENITMSDDDYAETLDVFAKDYNVSKEELVSYYGDEYLRGFMLWKKTMDILFGWASVTYGE